MIKNKNKTAEFCAEMTEKAIKETPKICIREKCYWSFTKIKWCLSFYLQSLDKLLDTP